MNDNDKSLVAADEQKQPEEETLSASLGGYPALILFVVTLIVIVLVFALPTPANPAADIDGADDDAVAIAALATEETFDAQAVGAATEEAVAEVAETEEAIVEAAETEEAVVESATEEAVEAVAETEEAAAEAATEEAVEAVAETEEAAAEAATEEAVEAVAKTEEAVVETIETEEPVEVAMVPVVPGDAAAGEMVFNTRFEATGFSCSSCHTVTADRDRILGPTLYGIAVTAEERILETGDPNIETYVLNSILHPRDFIIPPDEEGQYADQIMPANWGETLSPQELQDVLAYILSVGDEGETIALDEVVTLDSEAAMEESADMTEPEAPATEEPVEEAAAADAGEDVVAAAIAAGDVALGQELFNTTHDTAVGPWMCASCHSVDESMVRLVGPGQWGLYERAEEHLAESGDPDVVTYIRNSILNPTAYIVPADDGAPYPENLMPPNFGEIFSDEELDAVVAYLLTLGNPDYTG